MNVIVCMANDVCLKPILVRFAGALMVVLGWFINITIIVTMMERVGVGCGCEAYIAGWHYRKFDIHIHTGWFVVFAISSCTGLRDCGFMWLESTLQSGIATIKCFDSMAKATV